MTEFHTQYAWLGGDVVETDVVIAVEQGVITRVESGVAPPHDAIRLQGLTIPGFGNAHSHAFHRALRGRTHRGTGSFWTWREDMYAVADRLTPQTYFDLAFATYAEMALAGITSVGEFHYLHHDRSGRPYANPNAMGEALIAAAEAAGIRITLLDACYLSGGFDLPLEGPQVRFGDGGPDEWAERASQLADQMRDYGHARVGAAIHSVRAVPPKAMEVVARWADVHEAPLHFHLSEQKAENTDCLNNHRCTPTQLLADHGALSQRASAVHATHLTPRDIGELAGARTTICMTPTTERDLADGIGPARTLADAGSPISLGSDSNAVIDPFEETRGLELDERLRSNRRGNWRATELLTAATVDSHASLGWANTGRLEVGATADFVTVSLDSVRLAGSVQATLLESVVFAAAAADVNDVVVAGRHIVKDGQHQLLPDVAGALRSSIAALS